MTLICAASIVLDGRVCRPGWVRTTLGTISGCGPGVPPGQADHEFADALIVPGFVDMHVHGGGGASYTDAATHAGEIGRAAAFHRRHGTTRTLASLVSAEPVALLDAVSALAEATRRGVIAGIHLEGPWLSSARCGAHDPNQLRPPDAAEIDALLAAAAGTIRMVTLAPELPGTAEAIRHFVDAGVVVAVGHTDADYLHTQRAIDAGAAVGTHLFNAMRPVHHREPGPVPALLADPRVTVELIADGVHVHPALIRHVIDAVGPQRVALVTDAMAAAGSGDGCYRLGAVDVEVVDSVARLRGTSTIAGSIATMDQLFATAVGLLGGTDAALAAAVQMTATTPARRLGLDESGCLEPGAAANLVVLDADLQVITVMADGAWVT